MMIRVKDNHVSKFILQILAHLLSIHIANKKSSQGVPVVARWITNPTRNDEDAGLSPGIAQWVKDPVLL